MLLLNTATVAEKNKAMFISFVYHELSNMLICKCEESCYLSRAIKIFHPLFVCTTYLYVLCYLDHHVSSLALQHDERNNKERNK